MVPLEKVKHGLFRFSVLSRAQGIETLAPNVCFVSIEEVSTRAFPSAGNRNSASSATVYL